MSAEKREGEKEGGCEGNSHCAPQLEAIVGMGLERRSSVLKQFFVGQA